MRNFSLKDITKNTNTKELADDLGISFMQTRRHINGDPREIKVPIFEQIKIWMHHTDGDEMIKALCEDQGGHFYKEIHRDDYTDIKVVPKILKEFSEFMTEVAQSYADGVVTQREYDRIRKEFNELLCLVMGMFSGIERELLRK
jgi:hypothetical protein